MEAQDIYGTRIRLTRDGLTYGEEFVPFAEMGGRQPESHVFWNPGTRLFEVAVLRRNGPDLITHLTQKRRWQQAHPRRWSKLRAL